MNKIICIFLLLGLAFYSGNILNLPLSAVHRAIRRFVDDRWLGVQRLATELHNEFDFLADPILDGLQTEKHIRLSAVAAYRRHFGDMKMVAEWTAREQRIQMRLVSEALDGVAEKILADERIIASIAKSRYNMGNIMPPTWALVFRVINSRKKTRALQMDQASDRVCVELSDMDAVVNEMFKEPKYNKPVEPTYYEKLTTFVTECLVLFGSVQTLAMFQ